jgi:hypothetical protein
MSSAPDTRRRPHRVYWHPARDDLGNEKSVFKGGIDVEGGSIKHLMLLTYGRGQPPDRTAPTSETPFVFDQRECGDYSGGGLRLTAFQRDTTETQGSGRRSWTPRRGGLDW